MPEAKRVSSLVIAEDLGATEVLYAGLGFERVESDDPSCVGYLAGETGVILANRDFAARCWGAGLAEQLTGQCVPYIYLDALDETPRGEVLTDTRTSFGTRERVVRTAGGPVILVTRE